VTPYIPDVVPVVPIVPDVVPVVVDPQPAVITLMNPADTNAPVNYSLGNNQYSLAAGDEMVHEEGAQVISFNRGGQFGEARYTLQPGTYRFVATNHGWDLHTVTEEATAETTDNGNTSSLTWLNGG